MDGGEGHMRLKDKVALVTGSSGGLGTGICRAFAAEGADCVVNYHSDRAGGQETADLVESLGRQSLLVQADISREDQVQAMVDAALERFGRLDIVVANAGYGLAKPLLETRVEEFEKLVRTNLIGTYLTVRIGAQAMKSQGSGKIITMSSVHGLGGTHYCSPLRSHQGGNPQLHPRRRLRPGRLQHPGQLHRPGSRARTQGPASGQGRPVVCRLDAVHAPLPFRGRRRTWRPRRSFWPAATATGSQVR